MSATETSPTLSAGDEPFVSLYRRFRPSTFAMLRGQPHVVRALRSAVRDGHVAHAYLFSGPRGTGKTSAARILARALNCANPDDGEPCGVCTSCLEIARGTSLDVHELDAASNNGVDAMRDLISHAALGTPGRWKVYIVDEVHMLSNAAANALLKTLEEPPGHVIFVLATTDPQKVTPTIRSRTQHFEFRLLGADTLEELLRDVRDAAGLAVDDDAVEVAVRRGRGSARDALSALDQVAASGSADDARPDIDDLLEGLEEDDAGRVLVAVAALTEAGWGPQQLAGELVDELRQAFLVALAPELAGAVGGDPERLAAQADRLGLPRMVRAMESLGRAQVDMREAPDARVVLEVALARLARSDLDDSPGALVERLARLERAQVDRSPAPRPAVRPSPAADPEPGPAASPSAGEATPADPVPAKPGLGALRRQRQARANAPVAEPGPEPSRGPLADPEPAAPPGERPDRDTLVEAWGDHVLRRLPAKAKALYSAGRFVDVTDDGALFALPNEAHRERCSEVRPLVESALAEHFSTPVPLVLVLEGEAPTPTGRPVASDADGDPEGDGAPEAFEVGAGDGGEAVEARLFEAFPGAQEVSE